MSEFDYRSIVRGLSALALAGVLALVLALVSSVDLSRAAAPDRAAELVAGQARVIDGDTLDVAGTRIRLEGIDAPESGQQCIRGSHAPRGGSWGCGAAATDTLAALVAGREVQCDGSERDSYGRLIAICRVGSMEINAELVRRGLAWAFVRYSRRLVSVERDARKIRLGIWQGDNEPAWDYRARRWAEARPQASGGCTIKGNISRHGHIYHLPGSAFYDAVRIDSSRGERWFCSEAEAIAAGWRQSLAN